MKKLIKVLGIFFILTGCGSSFKTVDSNEIIKLIESNENVYIIDVRENNEYDTGHIEDAVNIPVSKINSITYDKNSIIIVYCATGVRSKKAAESLISNGYKNVYNLDGGLINWGFDLED